MSKDSKKSDSNFNLENYSSDKKSGKVSGSVKNCLAWQAIREGTFGIVIIQLEFEVKTEKKQLE